MAEQFNIAVVGASGAIGSALLELLVEQEFPVGTLYPLETVNQDNETVMFDGKSRDIKPLADFDWEQVQLAFFCSDKATAETWAPRAADAGTIVIDSSEAFRDRPEVPLVIPHINPQAIADFRNTNIIASPDAGTVQLWTVLKTIHDQVGVSRINVTSHHSVSSAGEAGVKELARQCGKLLNGLPVDDSPYPAQLAFNVLPQVGEILENGYSRQEQQLIDETDRLLGDSGVLVNPTSVMTPVFYGQAQAVSLETYQPCEPEQVIEWLHQSEEVEFCDDHLPTQVGDATGQDQVFVGRVHQDISHPQGIKFWSVADNVRFGGALNSLRIAQLLVKEYY